MDGTDSINGQDVERAARRSTTLGLGVRFGLVAYGVVHLLVAWVAVSLVVGGSHQSASGRHALRQLAQTPVGALVLVAMAVGFAALVVWQLKDAAVGHREHDGLGRAGLRVGSAVKVGVYGYLGYSSATVGLGLGSSGSGSGGTDGPTARLMSAPAGQVLVALVGAAVLGYAAVVVRRGLGEHFKQNLERQGLAGHTGTVLVVLARVGHLGKGAALGMVGVLFGWAAWSHDPQKSGGLGQALHRLLAEPYGGALVAAIGVGIGCFGLFCFAWARYLDR